MGASFTETNGKSPVLPNSRVHPKAGEDDLAARYVLHGPVKSTSAECSTTTHHHAAHVHIGCGLTGKLGTGEMAHN